MNKEGKFLKKLCCGVGESGYQGKLVLSIEFKTKIGHSFSLNHSQDNAAKGLLDLYELNLPAYTNWGCTFPRYIPHSLPDMIILCRQILG